MGTQTAGFGFMVKFQDIKGKAKEEPFHGDITFTPGKKSAEVHIFFGHGKGTLGLDGAVDAEQTALLGRDALLHFFPLAEEIFVYIEGLCPVCQRFFAGAFPNTFFFAGTSRTIFTAINGSFGQKTSLRFLLFYL